MCLPYSRKVCGQLDASPNVFLVIKPITFWRLDVCPTWSWYVIDLLSHFHVHILPAETNSQRYDFPNTFLIKVQLRRAEVSLDQDPSTEYFHLVYMSVGVKVEDTTSVFDVLSKKEDVTGGSRKMILFNYNTSEINSFTIYIKETNSVPYIIFNVTRLPV